MGRVTPGMPYDRPVATPGPVASPDALEDLPPDVPPKEIGNGGPPTPPEDVLGQMARRPRYKADNPERKVPKMRRVAFKANRWRVFGRLLKWVAIFGRLMIGIRINRARGKRDVTQEAIQIRRTLERAGGTFVKIGQQLGNRVDLLPYEVCHELSSMFDSMEHFPVEHAIAAIENATGQPMHEIFSRFDPKPIGSASIACVYQGLLLNGDKVAVKVRRPGIGERFAEDLMALDWLGNLAEKLTLVRPQFTSMLRQDLRDMLMEELDFVSEARYQEHFRRQLKKDRIKFCTAPRSYPDWSNQDVHFEEFIPGIFLQELLDAFETGDEEELAKLKEQGITPKKVGKRLLYVSYWSALEGILFHADPHPANVVVRADSKLVFIDFGSCGSTSDRTRRIRWEIQQHLVRNDISAATRAAIAMLEPLSHVDPDELLKRAEKVWWKFLYSMRSKHAQWWERTSAGLWLGLLEATRDFGLQINQDTLRMLRASLLYDTLAARLWPKLDDEVYLKYRREMYRRRARRRVDLSAKETEAERWMRRVTQLEEASLTAEKMFSKLQDFTQQSPKRFLKLASKASFAATHVLLLTAQLVVPVILVVGAQLGVSQWYGVETDRVFELLLQMTFHPAYVLYALFLTTLTFRKLAFRFADRDDD